MDRAEREPIDDCRNALRLHVRDDVRGLDERLLREIDGPMLRTGLQGFHGEAIAVPRRPEDRPDPVRLEARFERFVRAAA